MTPCGYAGCKTGVSHWLLVAEPAVGCYYSYFARIYADSSTICLACFIFLFMTGDEHTFMCLTTEQPQQLNDDVWLSWTTEDTQSYPSNWDGNRPLEENTWHSYHLITGQCYCQHYQSSAAKLMTLLEHCRDHSLPHIGHIPISTVTIPVHIILTYL